MFEFFKKFKKLRFTVMVFEFGIVVFVSALPIFSSVVALFKIKLNKNIF